MHHHLGGYAIERAFLLRHLLMKTMLQLVLLGVLVAQGWASAVTAGVSTASNANGSSYASGAFTPAAGDLLVVFVTATGTIAAGTMTDSQGLGFTKITTALKNTSADTLYLFISNNTAAASSMTVTFDCTGDNATGATIQVARVTAMSRTGSSASRQTAKQENQASGGTPAPVFGSAALTANPTLGLVGNSTNPATMTAPGGTVCNGAGYTERDDTGHTLPTDGSEYVSCDSGFTGTTITWGGTSASVFGDIIVELNTSVPPPPTCINGIPLLGAGCN